jgi:hypothetical protein
MNSSMKIQRPAQAGNPPHLMQAQCINRPPLDSPFSVPPPVFQENRFWPWYLHARLLIDMSLSSLILSISPPVSLHYATTSTELTMPSVSHSTSKKVPRRSKFSPRFLVHFLIQCLVRKLLGKSFICLHDVAGSVIQHHVHDSLRTHPTATATPSRRRFWWRTQHRHRGKA